MIKRGNEIHLCSYKTFMAQNLGWACLHNI